MSEDDDFVLPTQLVRDSATDNDGITEDMPEDIPPTQMQTERTTSMQSPTHSASSPIVSLESSTQLIESPAKDEWSIEFNSPAKSVSYRKRLKKLSEKDIRTRSLSSRRKRKLLNTTSTPSADGELQCGICLEVINKNTYGSEDKLLGTLDHCSHIYCLTCIVQWTEVSSTCPMCKAAVNAITKRKFSEWVSGSSDSTETIRVVPKKQRVASDDEFYDDEEEEEYYDSESVEEAEGDSEYDLNDPFIDDDSDSTMHRGEDEDYSASEEEEEEEYIFEQQQRRSTVKLSPVRTRRQRARAPIRRTITSATASTTSATSTSPTAVASSSRPTLSSSRATQPTDTASSRNESRESALRGLSTSYSNGSNSSASDSWVPVRRVRRDRQQQRTHSQLTIVSSVPSVSSSATIASPVLSHSIPPLPLSQSTTNGNRSNNRSAPTVLSPDTPDVHKTRSFLSSSSSTPSTTQPSTHTGDSPEEIIPETPPRRCSPYSPITISSSSPTTKRTNDTLLDFHYLTALSTDSAATATTISSPFRTPTKTAKSLHSRSSSARQSSPTTTTTSTTKHKEVDKAWKDLDKYMKEQQRESSKSTQPQSRRASPTAKRSSLPPFFVPSPTPHNNLHNENNNSSLKWLSSKRKSSSSDSPFAMNTTTTLSPSPSPLIARSPLSPLSPNKPFHFQYPTSSSSSSLSCSPSIESQRSREICRNLFPRPHPPSSQTPSTK